MAGKRQKRAIYWDDVRPLEYFNADSKITFAVDTWLTLFQGKRTEIQAPQKFSDGNPTVSWKSIVLMTAKNEGLWDLVKGVSEEDLDHIKARRVFFHIEGPPYSVAEREGIPANIKCGPSWCRWVIAGSERFGNALVRGVKLNEEEAERLHMYHVAGGFGIARGAAMAQGHWRGPGNSRSSGAAASSSSFEPYKAGRKLTPTKLTPAELDEELDLAELARLGDEGGGRARSPSYSKLL